MKYTVKFRRTVTAISERTITVEADNKIDAGDVASAQVASLVDDVDAWAVVGDETDVVDIIDVHPSDGSSTEESPGDDDGEE